MCFSLRIIFSFQPQSQVLSLENLEFLHESVFFLKIFHALKIGLKGAQRFSDHLIFVSMTYIPNLMQEKPLWVVMFSFRPKSYNTVALFWQIAVAFVFNLVGLRFHILTPQRVVANKWKEN